MPQIVGRDAELKLIQSQISTPEPGRLRAKADQPKPALPVEAVTPTKGSGSYTSHGKLPGHFIERNEQAIHAYRLNASLDADGGELIGIDTYA